MDEPIRDDVDETIDLTARAMLAVDPDGTFDARVRAAVSRRSPVAWPGLAAAVACGVLAAIVMVPSGLRWFEPAAGPDAPGAVGHAGEAVRTVPPVAAPPDPAVVAGAGQAIAADARGRERERAAPAPQRRPRNAGEHPRSAITPGVDTVARGEPAVPIAGAEPLPGVEPLPAIEPLTIASLPREAASLQARLIAPLEPIAAIEIPPLSPSEWRE